MFSLSVSLGKWSIMRPGITHEFDAGATKPGFLTKIFLNQVCKA